jgi:hypothetical protein
VANKIVKNKKTVVTETKTEQPPAIFLGEKAYPSVSLIFLGVVAVILGFLSTTPIMARTIFSEKPDFIVGMGLVGIVVGLVLNNRKKISAFFDSNKKDK